MTSDKFGRHYSHRAQSGCCVVWSRSGICHIISRNWVWAGALTVNLCCDLYQTWLLIRARRVIDNFRQMNSEDLPHWVCTKITDPLTYSRLTMMLSCRVWKPLSVTRLSWLVKKAMEQTVFTQFPACESLGDNEWGHYGNIFPVLQSGLSLSPPLWQLWLLDTAGGNYHRNRPHELWTGGKSLN